MLTLDALTNRTDDPFLVSLTAPTNEAAAFNAAFDDFQRASRRARGRYARHASAGELSISQYHLLEPLAGGAGLPLGELAEAAGVSSPSATRMLDGLERRAVVERLRDPADRRRVRIRLTPAGAELVARKREQVAAAREAIFASLRPSERRAAARLLSSLAAAIEDLHP